VSKPDIGQTAWRSRLIRFGGYLHRRTAAFGVLFIALLLSVLAWYYVRQTVEVQNRARFEESAQATQDAIERRTKAYLDAIFGARGLFYASNEVTREEWNAYVKGIKPASRFEGLQALGFAQRVEPEDRESFMRRAQDEGLPEMRPDLNPGGERSEYFPLTYIGPLDEANQRMLNHDFYAEVVHKEAMELARDSGEPQATEMVYVLGEAPPWLRSGSRLTAGFRCLPPDLQGGRAAGECR
jgi:CHASE1-domain containing sensor protein